MQCMKDPNTTFKILATSAVLENHEKFSVAKLQVEFVPELMKEVAKGWNESEPWILQNFSKLVKFLQDRGLVKADYVETLHKFFDVPQLIIFHFRQGGCNKQKTKNQRPHYFCRGVNPHK